MGRQSQSSLRIDNVRIALAAKFNVLKSIAGGRHGSMASLGCGLLIVGLLAMMAVAIAEQGGLVVRAWPKVLLAVLGAFLALQLLMLIFPKARKRSGS